MAVSQGQTVALEQLEWLVKTDRWAVEILDHSGPGEDSGHLRVELSLDCGGVVHEPGGLELRDREVVHLLVPADFPFQHPTVFVTHQRWAGTPHVQWGHTLCLYAAPATEWDPSDGMYGFLQRLWLWLNRASAGDLDPDDAPLHPPVAYTSSLDEVPMVIPRVDTPHVESEPWIGGVTMEKVSEDRIDLVGWNPNVRSWLDGAAPAILLPSTLSFEYPRTVAQLRSALAERGVSRDQFMAVLKLAALGLDKDDPLLLVLGTAMRGTADDRRQHLAAWYVTPVIAWGLAHSLRTISEDYDLRESAARVTKLIDEWADGAEIHWCPVRESRPEVTRRRDTGSPMRWFDGKTVAVWGCGALGAPISEWLARAGVAKIILYDKASVSPGVLVRQPFLDREVGTNKARIVARRLKRIRPRDLEVEVRARNVLRSCLNRDEWHDGADLVIDATAALAVATKTERARRDHPSSAHVASVVIGHTAQHGMATLAPAGYSGSTADVERQIKLACGRNPNLEGFLDEFWPEPPRTRIFQPEPGCSDPTFTGSGAEVAALAGRLINLIASDLVGVAQRPLGDTASVAAVGHLVAHRPAHPGVRESRLVFPAAHVVEAPGHDLEIRIAPTAVMPMRSWIRRSARLGDPLTETGGLLFGERNPAAGVLWVDEVVGPPPDSYSAPDAFICGTDGVDRYEAEKDERGRGSLQYLGMWHTHPDQDPMFSRRDLDGMQRLLDASSSPLARGLLLIVGRTVTDSPSLGAFLFERTDLDRPEDSTIWITTPTALPAPTSSAESIGLALSGGGSRAIAFHLGCLRALHDRGVLDRVRVISSVSGGSLINAMWAYTDDDFASFDARVETLLRRGLQVRITRRALLSVRLPQQIGTRLVAGGSATMARLVCALGWATRQNWRPDPPLRRWVSRTDAFADVLARDVCGSRRLDAARRNDVHVVINACDLRTGSAFRFGSRESSCSRLGTVAENDVAVADAVAASAAYPLLLPALDRQMTFEKRDGQRHDKGVVLTDGGVFDNLGTSCLQPNRSAAHTHNIFSVDHIIACDAGRGLLEPTVPFGWIPRVQRAFESTFRKLQDAGRGKLHDLSETDQLAGFVMPYLGQQDHRLPVVPTDLVARGEVADYPTNFRAMPQETIDLLSSRGEQLTNLMLDAYLPAL